MRKDLSLDQGGQVTEFHVEDFSAFDLRAPADSPAITRDCYPHGLVPGVRLGTASNPDK